MRHSHARARPRRYRADDGARRSTMDELAQAAVEAAASREIVFTEGLAAAARGGSRLASPIIPSRGFIGPELYSART
jgi:hypothetical protein